MKLFPKMWDTTKVVSRMKWVKNVGGNAVLNTCNNNDNFYSGEYFEVLKSSCKLSTGCLNRQPRLSLTEDSRTTDP